MPIEQIDGHQYEVTRDAQGNEISRVAADPAPAPVTPPIRTASLALLTALKAGTATAQQQQQAMALILGLLLNLSQV